jgi:hypothetical protein
MKFFNRVVFMVLFLIASGAQAAETDLDKQTVYSAAAITMGASSIIHGNLQAVAAATLGADAEVGGHLVSGAAVKLGANGKVGGNLDARDAGTIGADATIGGNLTTGDAATLGATTIDENIMVGSNLTAGAAILVGVKSKIGGDLTSGAAAPADLGASASVGGSAKAGTALTLGANAKVGSELLSPTPQDCKDQTPIAQAGTGAVALGEGAKVNGKAQAGTFITVPASAKVGCVESNKIEQFAKTLKGKVDNKNDQVADKQEVLRGAINPTPLAASQTVSIDLKSGVHHATALTTTAGTTLTFKGSHGSDAEHWLINVDTFINFGANMKMVLDDVNLGSTITFNAGGYTAIGAGSEILGTYYAGTYMTTGANVTLNGVDKPSSASSTGPTATCGGMVTASGGITLGASNTIGSEGCTQGAGLNNGAAAPSPPLSANGNVGAVNLGSADEFVILAKTGVSTTGTTAITGDVGVSPIALTSITGFNTTLDASTTYATSALVNGKIYSADMTPPTPAKMTTAISDMETAYTDAAGRAPDYTELHAGKIGSLTLPPGTYKWSTNVWIDGDLTLDAVGDATSVWIFQISGDLIQASATSVILAGSAKSRNVFWQVDGGAGVVLDTGANFAGIVLAHKAIVVRTGAEVNGRLLGQTAVTLDANEVMQPAQ